MTLDAPRRELAEGAPGFEGAVAPGSRVVRVRYEAEQANVAEVLAALITDFLERDFVMNPKINQNVSLSIDEEMTVEEIERFVAGCARSTACGSRKKTGGTPWRWGRAADQGRGAGERADLHRRPARGR